MNAGQIRPPRLSGTSRLTSAPGASREMAATRSRPVPKARLLARRRMIVVATKWALPGAALLLLLSVALWPELSRLRQQEQSIARRLVATDTSRMRAPHYRGVDDRGRPFTVTAGSALQSSPQRVELAAPKADVMAEGGDWLYVQSAEGVFIQHAGQLDLSQDVTLYRSDGMTLFTDSAAVEIKVGAVASNTKTHVEGPFGSIDAQGFFLLDKGATIQFTGPARMIVNQSK